METYRAYYDETIIEIFIAEDDEDAISTAEFIGENEGYPNVWEIYELDCNLNDKRCIY